LLLLLLLLLLAAAADAIQQPRWRSTSAGWMTSWLRQQAAANSVSQFKRALWTKLIMLTTCFV
jgi:hypothetical protein